MNLYFRLLWQSLFGSRRSPVPVLGPCRTPFRVLPSDLDVLRHVNNGVYLSLMDVARVDLMQRAGLAGPLRRHGWYPVVVAESIQFRRSLGLFQRFEIETRVLGWDEKAFVVEQRFFRGEEAIAVALVRARFLARGGGAVAPADVVHLVGPDIAQPVMSPDVARWNEDHATWRGTAA